jgi:hypothetical protein
MTPRFAKKRDGRIDLTLERAEADLIEGLPEQLLALYEGERTDPARQRLFPRAYLDPTEEEAETQWEALVHPDLLAGRLAALEQLRGSLAGAEPGRRDRIVVHIQPDDVNAWLSVLNDARLALASRLGVSEDTDLMELDPSDPESAGKAAYAWLTYLQGELVETLLGDLPG